MIGYREDWSLDEIHEFELFLSNEDDISPAGIRNSIKSARNPTGENTIRLIPMYIDRYLSHSIGIDRQMRLSDFLITSVRYDRISLCQYLVDEQEVPVWLGSASDSLVEVACEHGSARCLQFLLERRTPFPSGSCPMEIACQYGHTQCVAVLAKYKFFGEPHFFPLHCAAANGYVSILELPCWSFRQKQAQNPERNDMSALHCAALGGHWDCIQVLLRDGVPVDQPMKHGITILHIAIKKQYSDIACRLIREWNASILTKIRICTQGSNCLERACTFGLVDVVRTCLDVLSDDCMDYAQCVWLACCHGHAECMKIVLTKYPFLLENQLERYPTTLCWIACRHGHLSCLRILKMLDPRFDDVTQLADPLDSPLTVARQYNHMDCAEFVQVNHWTFF